MSFYCWSFFFKSIYLNLDKKNIELPTIILHDSVKSWIEIFFIIRLDGLRMKIYQSESVGDLLKDLRETFKDHWLPIVLMNLTEPREENISERPFQNDLQNRPQDFQNHYLCICSELSIIWIIEIEEKMFDNSLHFSRFLFLLYLSWKLGSTSQNLLPVTAIISRFRWVYFHAPINLLSS